MLKRATNEPLPSQDQDDSLPDPIDTTVPREQQEFVVEKILKAKKQRRGQGFQRMVLVKWYGQKEPTWEPLSEMQETIALDEFEKKYGIDDDVGETNIGTPIENRIKN